MGFRNTLLAFIDFLYPNLCLLCKTHLVKEEKELCLGCLYSLPRSNSLLDSELALSKILWGRIPLKLILAQYNFIKGNQVQYLIHQLKYKGNADIGFLLGRELGISLRARWKRDPPFLLPVPIHRNKLKQRGYNQAQIIAEGVASATGWKILPNVLISNKSKASLTRLGRKDRFKKVFDSFEIGEMPSTKVESIILIDDIITTGATIEACCALLLEIDGVELSVACLASTI